MLGETKRTKLFLYIQTVFDMLMIWWHCNVECMNCIWWLLPPHVWFSLYNTALMWSRKLKSLHKNNFCLVTCHISDLLLYSFYNACKNISSPIIPLPFIPCCCSHNFIQCGNFLLLRDLVVSTLNPCPFSKGLVPVYSTNDERIFCVAKIRF